MQPVQCEVNRLGSLSIFVKLTGPVLVTWHAGELQGAALTRLALQTLVSFDFGSARLLDFVRDHVTPYLDDADVSVRRASAAAAAAVLHRTAIVTPGSRAAIHPQVCHPFNPPLYSHIHHMTPVMCWTHNKRPFGVES